MEKILVISDVDGVMTDGGLYYTYDGKIMKKFGSNDHEAIDLLKSLNIEVQFITADKTGYNIVEQRITKDCKSDLCFISQKDRIDYIKEKTKEYDKVVFFGDGLKDAKAKMILGDKLTFMCPMNSFYLVKQQADYISPYTGGNNAFLDMAFQTVKVLGLNQIGL